MTTMTLFKILLLILIAYAHASDYLLEPNQCKLYPVDVIDNNNNIRVDVKVNDDHLINIYIVNINQQLSPCPPTTFLISMIQISNREGSAYIVSQSGEYSVVLYNANNFPIIYSHTIESCTIQQRPDGDTYNTCGPFDDSWKPYVIVLVVFAVICLPICCMCLCSTRFRNCIRCKRGYSSF